MMFSVNQVRHLYVLNSYKDPESTDEAGTGYMIDNNGEDVYLKYKGAAGITRSDLIKKSNIKYVTVAKAEDIALKLKGTVVELNPEINGGNPVAGQNYVLKVVFREFLSLSPKDQIVKLGTVHATPGMSANDFYCAMALSLAQNSVMDTPLMDVYVDNTLVTPNMKLEDLKKKITGATNILIMQAEQEWHLGTMQQGVIPFEVLFSEIRLDGDNMIWGKQEPADRDAWKTLPEGQLIADLEYFCMGERGDIYRNLGWPNVIPTKYLVDPEEEYDIVSIHYYFQGSNEAVQLSEKDIQLAVLPEFTDTIRTFFKTLGVTIKEKK